MSDWPQSLVLAGAGKMGGAMLKGWLAGGLPADGVTVIDPHPSDEMVAYARERGLRLNPPEGATAPPEVLVLAIKPQMLESAADRLAPIAGADTLVLSVLAGKTIANLRSRLHRRPRDRARHAQHARRRSAGARRRARRVRSGPARQSAWTERLMRAVGVFDWLADENLIDAVTALSGSGPAYVFALVEAMAKAGEKVGLPADLAMRLARATVEGAGELLYREPETSAAQLRINVTSPARHHRRRAGRVAGAGRPGRAAGGRRRRGPSTRGRTRRLILPWRFRRAGLTLCEVESGGDAHG